MKGFICDYCGDHVIVSNKKFPKMCCCKRYLAKYLADGITLAINGHPIIFGIDNNSFAVAERNCLYSKDWKERVDFFFTGWIPNKPGEILFLKTKRQVMRISDNYTVNKTSTMPKSM